MLKFFRVLGKAQSGELPCMQTGLAVYGKRIDIGVAVSAFA